MGQPRDTRRYAILSLVILGMVLWLIGRRNGFFDGPFKSVGMYLYCLGSDAFTLECIMPSLPNWFVVYAKSLLTLFTHDSEVRNFGDIRFVMVVLCGIWLVAFRWIYRSSKQFLGPLVLAVSVIWSSTLYLSPDVILAGFFLALFPIRNIWIQSSLFGLLVIGTMSSTQMVGGASSFVTAAGLIELELSRWFTTPTYFAIPGIGLLLTMFVINQRRRIDASLRPQIMLFLLLMIASLFLPGVTRYTSLFACLVLLHLADVRKGLGRPATLLAILYAIDCGYFNKVSTLAGQYIEFSRVPFVSPATFLLPFFKLAATIWIFWIVAYAKQDSRVKPITGGSVWDLLDQIKPPVFSRTQGLSLILLAAVLAGVGSWTHLRGLGQKSIPISVPELPRVYTLHFDQEDAPASLWLYHLSGKHMVLAITCGEEKKRRLGGRRTELTWIYMPLPSGCHRPRIYASSRDGAGISEVTAYRGDLSVVVPTEVCDRGVCVPSEQHKWFDEPYTGDNTAYPDYSAVVDEIYNAGPGIGKLLRLNLEPMFLTSHPYLGRALIYYSMQAFGIGPFGWRLPSAIGSILIPLLGMLLIWRMRFGWVTVGLSGVLLSLNLLSNSLGQTAFLDNLICCAVLAHITLLAESFWHRNCPGRAILLLSLSGIFLGIAGSLKWLGFFIGIVTVPVAVTYGIWISCRHGRTMMTAGGVLAALVVSLILYCASYSPFVEPDRPLLTQIKEHTLSILYKHRSVRDYASEKIKAKEPDTLQSAKKSTEDSSKVRGSDKQAVVANRMTMALDDMLVKLSDERDRHQKSHAYDSGLVEWMWAVNTHGRYQVDIKPNPKEAAYLMSNPVLSWWVAAAFLFWMCGVFPRRDLRGVILAWITLSSVAVWLVVARYSMIYHGLPWLVFGTLMLSVTLEHFGRYRFMVTSISLITIAIAALYFWPAMAGTTLSEESWSSIRWFSTWFLR